MFVVHEGHLSRRRFHGIDARDHLQETKESQIEQLVRIPAQRPWQRRMKEEEQEETKPSTTAASNETIAAKAIVRKSGVEAQRNGEYDER